MAIFLSFGGTVGPGIFFGLEGLPAVSAGDWFDMAFRDGSGNPAIYTTAIEDTVGITSIFSIFGANDKDFGFRFTGGNKVPDGTNVSASGSYFNAAGVFQFSFGPLGPYPFDNLGSLASMLSYWGERGSGVNGPLLRSVRRTFPPT